MGCLKKSESDDVGSNNDGDKGNFDFNKALESIGHFGRYTLQIQCIINIVLEAQSIAKSLNLSGSIGCN